MKHNLISSHNCTKNSKKEKQIGINMNLKFRNCKNKTVCCKKAVSKNKISVSCKNLILKNKFKSYRTNIAKKLKLCRLKIRLIMINCKLKRMLLCSEIKNWRRHLLEKTLRLSHRKIKLSKVTRIWLELSYNFKNFSKLLCLS